MREALPDEDPISIRTGAIELAVLVLAILGAFIGSESVDWSVSTSSQKFSPKRASRGSLPYWEDFFPFRGTCQGLRRQEQVCRRGWCHFLIQIRIRLPTLVSQGHSKKELSGRSGHPSDAYPNVSAKHSDVENSIAARRAKV